MHKYVQTAKEMSSINSYTNKCHIKMAAPQWGRVGSAAGERFFIKWWKSDVE